MKREDLLFIERMSNEWPQGWDGDRIRAGLRQIVEANAELLASLNAVTLECGNFHHAKKDQHKLGERCPVVDRAQAAIAKATGGAA
jgi:hypothetical protein